MKDVIIVAENDRENKELLAIEKADKTTMAEVAKLLNTIYLRSKYNWGIKNTDIDITGDLGLINIKILKTH